MAPQFIFSMRGVTKSYGPKPVLENISLSFYYGAKIGVVGENGAGKSTLLRIMAGLDKNFLGEAALTKGMRALLVPQEPQLDNAKTVRGNLDDSVAPVHKLIARYDEIAGLLGGKLAPKQKDALMDEMSRVEEQINAVEGWEIDRQLDIAADALVLPPDDADVRTLSGGERRRVALCKAFLERPDLLLLDEPTNHLDAETVAWLEQALVEYAGTVIIATHDRFFLDRITKWILELDGGRGIPYEGNYSSWLAQKSERLRVQEKKETDRQRVLQRELEWINTAPQARRKKNRDRITRYEEMAGRKFEASRSEVMIQIPPGPHLGDKVVEFRGVSKGYNGLNLIEDFSLSLPRGAIVGVVGPNGAGKTTLFRMIIGQEKPDRGTIELGPTVTLSYLDQHRDALDDKKTVYEEISGGKDEVYLGDRTINARAYCGRFNFHGPLQQKPVGQLSGGERNRVHLAKQLRTGGNLILLDEPTNDLDLDTMRVLEAALIDFPACAMVISHDRFFLDRICSHLLIFEGEGRLRWFDGDFEGYEEELVHTGHADHLSHRRNQYKRLPRR